MQMDGTHIERPTHSSQAGMKENGGKIKIWEDNWLPTLSTFKVQSPVKLLNQDETVSELISHHIRSWDAELIDQVMNEEEAKVICSLPLSRLGSEDKLIRGMSRSGLFNVKSAYYLAVKRKKQVEGEQSDNNRAKLGWQCIWKMRVPNTVKVFIWKAVNEAIPTKKKSVSQEGI